MVRGGDDAMVAFYDRGGVARARQRRARRLVLQRVVATARKGSRTQSSLLVYGFE